MACKSPIRSLMTSLLLLCAVAGAQLKLGSETEISGRGTVSAGYSGSYGDQTQSSHGLTFGGTADINGDFYNPNFLSFHVNPYFNQSRSNSEIQSITDATGVNAGANIFSGSHFPGSVSYSNSYNQTGNYHLPGSPDFLTTGKGQAFGVAWSEILPKLPSLMVGYNQGKSDYSVYGTSQNGTSNYRNFYLNSQYRLAGFDLSGGFGVTSGRAEIPLPYAGQPAEASQSHDTYYNVSASHLLPWHGSVAVSFNHNKLNNDYLGYKFNGAINTLTTTAGFYPIKSWNVSVTSNYSDNLAGQVYQAIIPTATGGTTGSGGQVGTAPPPSPVVTNSQTSRSFDLTGNTSYTFPRDLILSGNVSHRQQFYQGRSYSSDSFGGGGLYTHSVWGGFLNATLFANDTRVSYANLNSLGLLANGNYTRRVGEWDFSAGGNYSQNVQTLLITYTTSSYSMTGNVGRRFGRFAWHGGAGLGHSGLTAQPHTSFASQSYSMGLGYQGYSVQGSYSKSDGNGLALGNNGQVIPPVIPPELLILYGGSSYSATFSAAPKAGLTFSTTYLKSHSNTTTNAIFSFNRFEEESVQVQYRFRKMGITGGYTRVVQGFSASGSAPSTTSTFSVSVFRWLNLF